jgi:soluble lytic murein transglycosylase-like protein
MSAPVTARPVRRRRRGAALIALGLVVVLVATVVGAAIIALGDARVQMRLGRQVVVPEEYRGVIKDAARRCGAIPAEVLAAQIAAESGWDASAQSGAGAQGIAQFMPNVWSQYGIDGDNDGKADVWNPVDAIHSAAELNCLNRRLVRDAAGNRLRNTIAAYNAGYGAVLKYDGVPPFPETQDYVDKVLATARTIIL